MNDVFKVGEFKEVSASGVNEPDEQGEVVKPIEINGRSFRIVKKDPFDLWYIVSKGRLPKSLEGSYTSANLAQQAINLHYKKDEVQQ